MKSRLKDEIKIEKWDQNWAMKSRLKMIHNHDECSFRWKFCRSSNTHHDQNARCVFNMINIHFDENFIETQTFDIFSHFLYYCEFCFHLNI